VYKVSRPQIEFVSGFLTTVAAIAIMTGIGIEPHFVHMVGYAAGLAIAFAVSYGRGKERGSLAAEAKISILLASYALSLAALSLLVQYARASNVLAQVIALTIFLSCFSIGKIVVIRFQMAGLFGFRPLSTKHRWAILSGGATILVAANVWAAIAFEKSIDARASVPVSHRVMPWLSSAECFAKTGKILTLCVDSNRSIPIESAAVADDRGHTVILSLANRWLGASIGKRTLVLINFFIIVFGVWLLAAQFYRIGYRVAAVLLAAAALPIVNWPVVTADAPGSYLGLFALALVMPLQLLRMFLCRRPAAIEWAWFFLAAGTLAFVSLVREPFGLMAVITSVVALAIGMLSRDRRTSAWPIICIAALLAFVVANQSTRILVEYRTLVQGVPQSEGALSHGIAHNLYLGLGSEPNSFGIEYDDNFGVAAVKRYDPTIRYGTKKYYEAIRDLYFKLVVEHPAEVAWIYAAKFGKAYGLLVIPILAMILAVLTLGMSQSRKNGENPARIGPIVLVSPIVLLVVLNTMQGVLTTPSGNNFPAIVGFIALFSIALDVWCAQIASRMRVEPVGAYVI
jgi:hypothetical protein